jgi:pantoate--beta-alanine ligase
VQRAGARYHVGTFGGRYAKGDEMSEPRILRTAEEMRTYRRSLDGTEECVGFVPTMGALHEGHLSLLRAARARGDRTVVSIYVNPTQFGPGEDLNAYPRDLQRDLGLLGGEGAAVVFTPDDRTMYPEGFSTTVSVEGLTDGLCGAGRPGHFRGVTTVVAKLFNLVRPHRAYFGQKDAQQAAVIRRLARDLDTGVEIVVCPIVREPDGLALSSRNAYLDPEERAAAVCLYRALTEAERAVAGGETSPDRIRARMREVIGCVGGGLARPEYIEIVDPQTLKALPAVNRPSLAALAVFVGGTRLIDNLLLHPGT